MIGQSIRSQLALEAVEDEAQPQPEGGVVIGSGRELACDAVEGRIRVWGDGHADRFSHLGRVRIIRERELGSLPFEAVDVAVEHHEGVRGGLRGEASLEQCAEDPIDVGEAGGPKPLP